MDPLLYKFAMVKNTIRECWKAKSQYGYVCGIVFEGIDVKKWYFIKNNNSIKKLHILKKKKFA